MVQLSSELSQDVPLSAGGTFNVKIWDEYAEKTFSQECKYKNILTFIPGFESLWQKKYSTQRLRIKQLRVGME